MAAGGRFLSCMLAVLSALLTPGYGGYRQIDLTSASGVSCNMSSIFSSDAGRSLDCWGALNGNTDMTYLPGRDCVYTSNQPNEYWLVNLGQPRNIHRIIIYPETEFNDMRSTRVFVDEQEIYQFPTTKVTTAQTITNLLPVSGQIIKLTRPGNNYVTLCELQVYGCTFDSYGTNCTRTCSTGCNENAGDTVCDSINGTCMRECRAGWYGSDCEKPCSEHCQPDTDGNSRCRQTDGACNLACRNGYFGSRCLSPCGTGCVDNCNREDGACNCSTGWSSPNCAVASGEDDTQDGGNNAGPLVGGLLGAGALIGISVLLAAFMIIRWRRSRDTSNAADTDGAHFSSGDAPVRDVTEGDKPETETPGNESNYAPLEKYEDPDDIRPYSVLQDGGKLPKYLNTQSDQETALYQNTTVSKN